MSGMVLRGREDADETTEDGWEVGHYRQHLAYNAFLAAKTPPIIIPEFPILTFLSQKDEVVRKFGLNMHEQWHEQVRPFANVQSVDLSEVNLDNQKSFYEWMDSHNQEHSLIDTAFGLT